MELGTMGIASSVSTLRGKLAHSEEFMRFAGKRALGEKKRLRSDLNDNMIYKNNTTKKLLLYIFDEDRLVEVDAGQTVKVENKFRVYEEYKEKLPIKEKVIKARI